MFREKALAKLKSPEQLDQALLVIRLQKRLVVSLYLVLVALAVLWSLTGSLPETGGGNGIILTPGKVVPIQAPAGGQIGQWLRKVGDVVEKNQVLGILEQPDLERQLRDAEAEFLDLQERNREVSTLRQVSSRLQRDSITRKRGYLEARIDRLNKYIDQTEALSEETHANSLERLEVQRNNLETSKVTSEAIRDQLKERLASYERLRAEQLQSVDAVEGARRAYDDSRIKLSGLAFDLKQLELRRVQNQDAHERSMELISTHRNTLRELELQLLDLANQEAQLDKLDEESHQRELSQEEDLARTIARHGQRLQLNREIRSEHGGRILELTAKEGQVVTPAERLAQLDTRTEADPLRTLGYFQAKTGKQLRPGMRVRVEPDVAKKEIHGTIVGTLLSVTGYPVTAEAVANAVGNSEVAQKLTSGGFEIEAVIELAVDETTPSGLRWTSAKGADLRLTAGTTATVWMTLERRTPLSYVLPKIREWTGW